MIVNKQEILDYFADINLAYNDSSRYDTLAKMLDDLEVRRWILVEEALPYENVEVLIYVKDQFADTGYYRNGKWYLDWTYYETDDVVAWIPMPEFEDGDTVR